MQVLPHVRRSYRLLPLLVRRLVAAKDSKMHGIIALLGTICFVVGAAAHDTFSVIVGGAVLGVYIGRGVVSSERGE